MSTYISETVGLQIETMEPVDEAEYQAFVMASSASNYCHDLAWKHVIEDTYGKEPHYILCRDYASGRLASVAPAFWMESLLFGRRLVSLPYLDYGGIVADTREAAEAMVDALRNEARARGAGLELRQEFPLAGREAPSNAKVKMMLDLRNHSEQSYWKSLDAKVRNQVRKAEKSGITVKTGREELLEEFYRVFCVNMRDLGSPVHDLALFRNVLRHIPGAEISLALWNGYCVGGLLRIRWIDTMAIPWASTLRDYRGYCPNNALYWESLATALREGCTAVDFGRSTRNCGTHHFKRQWLAEESPLPWYSFEASGEAPAEVGGPGGLLQMASGLWTKLPARYANWLGPQIRGAISN
jgi:FemAB-related protein (PEP-CTERM system-associated)